MIQGTCSNAGKSLMVAGLCRALHRRGWRVRPFKPQNMSNNAAVTADGGEIGRAQALQARACGIEPSVHMNPVLLKPEAETGAQVVVCGSVRTSCSARDYHAMKPALMPEVLSSFERLAADAGIVVCEGAGSPAEVNLREGDIANMGFAQAADVPVVLVGDIDRGGVIASLVGTADLLEPEERALVRGYIVNKLRGDPDLFAPAHRIIEARTGLENLGVLTWFEGARDLPKEDVLGLDERRTRRRDGALRIVVPRLPRIANYDDLDPLLQEPDVRLDVLEPGEVIPGDADLVILAGSKSTISDLEALTGQGWDIDIKAHVRRGGAVLGLCGGYQMLGRSIADPDGIEGPPRTVAGLGLLDVETRLEPGKRLARVQGRELESGLELRGYEIHMGRTRGPDCRRPMLHIEGRPDGAVSTSGRVAGCYVHGLFAADTFRHAYLARLRARAPSDLAYEARVEETLDALAAHIEACLDMDRLIGLSRR